MKARPFLIAMVIVSAIGFGLAMFQPVPTHYSVEDVKAACWNEFGPDASAVRKCEMGIMLRAIARDQQERLGRAERAALQ